MIRKFLRQLWDWFFLDLDFEQTHECSACGVAAVWKISRFIYTCGYHYPWGVNRAGILDFKRKDRSRNAARKRKDRGRNAARAKREMDKRL